MKKKSAIFLFFIFCLCSSTLPGQSVRGKKVSLSFRSERMAEAFKKIEAVSGYKILFAYGDVRDYSVTCTIKNLTAPEAVKEVIGDKPLTFTVKDEFISVTAKPRVNTPPDNGSQRILKGVVLDAENEPLIGVTILVDKNPSVGTITDVDGTFTLKLPKGANTIRVSYLGMKTQLVKVHSDNLTIVMEEDMQQLGELVVTGYQTISKERATGAYDLVEKRFLEKPTTNIGTALIGNVSGIEITSDINGDVSMQVRGQTRLDPEGNAPLVVVDGFAVETDFRDINQNDVESITVLKDAAAASIWGARAGNGVIVITTKKGRKDKVSVEISSFMKMAPKIDLDYALPYAPTSQFVDYEIMTFNNWSSRWWAIADNTYSHGGLSPVQEALQELEFGYISEEESAHRINAVRSIDNRRQIRKYLLGNPFVHQHNVSISGGSEKISNRLSVLYEAGDTYLKGNGSDKVSIGYRNNIHLFNWLDFNFSGNYMQSGSTNNSPGLPRVAPYEMLVDDRGTRRNLSDDYYYPNLERYVPMDKFPYPDWSYNPITELENNDITTKMVSSRFQAGLTFKLRDNFTFETRMQYENVTIQDRAYFNENTYTVRNTVNASSQWDGNSPFVVLNLPKGGFLDQSRNELSVWYFRNQLNFSHTFAKKHDMNFVAGAETTDRVMETFGYPRTYGYNEETLSVGTFPNGPGGSGSRAIVNWMGYSQTFNYVNSFTHNTDRFFSLYANAAYTFDQKYTLSGSARTDASNLITDEPSYRYAPFWSVGGSWQLGREDYMRDVSWIDRLSLRFSYGYNGNVDKTTSFRPLIDMNSATDIYSGEKIATISSYGNPSLRWEKIGTFNLGLDYSFFNHKLFGKIDFYSKNSDDLIASVSIPAFNGAVRSNASVQKLNLGAMLNRGVEFEVRTILPIGSSKELEWSGGLNVSYNYNKITRLSKFTYSSGELMRNGNYDESASYVEGYDANTVWAFKYAGVKDYGTKDDPNWQPAFEDKDGNIFDITHFPPGDARNYLMNVGTGVAPWLLGLTSDFKIYDFHLSFIVTGKFGHKFLRRGFNYPAMLSARVLPNKYLEEVVNGDPNSIIPLPMNGAIENEYYNWASVASHVSYLAENASFVRMKEVMLTYDLPVSRLSIKGFNRCRVFGQVTNLFSVYANKYGQDPEFPIGGLKPQPTYTMGININF